MHIGTNIETNESVAIKIIKHESDQFDRRLLDKEIKAMRRIEKCRGCIQLLDVFEDSNGLYLVEELATGGELLERILEMGSFTEDIAACLIKQILEGLAEIHGLGVVHRCAIIQNLATIAVLCDLLCRCRDLKPENLLMVSGMLPR